MEEVGNSQRNREHLFTSSFVNYMVRDSGRGTLKYITQINFPLFLQLEAGKMNI